MPLLPVLFLQLSVVLWCCCRGVYLRNQHSATVPRTPVYAINISVIHSDRLPCLRKHDSTSKRSIRSTCSTVLGYRLPLPTVDNTALATALLWF